MGIQLTPHFSLKEMTRSDTAVRLGIDNIPNDVYRGNLVLLCEHVLEPVRDHFGPVRVNSGYRSLAVNMSVNKMTATVTKVSQHCTGHAVDFEVDGVSNYDVAKWCVENIPDFDQVILEFYTPGEPNSGWVHVSWSKEKSRKEVLTAVNINHKTEYRVGLIQ